MNKGITSTPIAFDTFARHFQETTMTESEEQLKWKEKFEKLNTVIQRLSGLIITKISSDSP